jgi:hypothetical protein
MYWRCKCGQKNPENARACSKCGSTEQATKKFYLGALITSSFVFFLVYAAGTSVGGTLVMFSIKPSDAEVLAKAKALGMEEEDKELKTLFALQPEQREEAEAKALEDARAQMSLIVRNVLFWITPFLLFVAIGTVVGFSTAGRTIIEAALGSAIGQSVAFVFLRFLNDVYISYIELGIGLAVGFFLAGAGAWVGEAIQEKRERATLDDEGRLSQVGIS